MHKISGSKNSIAPKGRPFIMYHLPQVYGTHDYLCSVQKEYMIGWQFAKGITKPADKDVYELVAILMDEHHLNLPLNSDEAIELYLTLRRLIISLL